MLAGSVDDPRFGANMALAAGLLGGNLGAGLTGFANSMQQQKQDAIKQQMQRLQLQQAQQAMADDQAKREYLASLPDLQTITNPDIQALTARGVRAGAVPMGEYLKLFQPTELPVNKLDPKDFTPESLAKFAQTRNYGDLQRLSELQFVDQGGGFLPVNKFTAQPAAAAIPKTGDPYKDLLLTGANGGMVPNQPLINAKTSIAKAGAPTTSVKVENKMGEGVAAQVGPMLKDSLTAANSAVQTVDAAGRIIQAVDSGKLIAGPGADVRLKLAQLGTVLGVTGKSTEESIANTRQAIRGLAEMTLQGRKQMTGQGAITESESALAERAMSGNVADLTAAEIRQLAQASERAARFIYNQHNSMVQQLEGTEARGVAPFYKPAPLPTSPKLATPMPAGVPGLRFLGFEGQ